MSRNGASLPILDPTPAQAEAAACAWYGGRRSWIAADEIEAFRAVLQAPDTYAALCVLGRVCADDPRRYEFPEDAYDSVQDARAAAHAITG